MKKSIIFLFTRFFIVISFAWAIFAALTLLAQEPPFQAPFDFDQFLSELEGALAKIEEEEKVKKTEQTPSKSEQQSISTRDKQAIVSSMSDTSTEKKDPETLFVDPTVVTLTPKTGPKTVVPTKESLQAYNTIMDEFTKNLSSIKNKVAALPRLSPSFKEEFVLFYQHLIDAIVIAHEQIKSKKAYCKLFLSPPEASKQLVIDMKKLRSMILNTAKKIKKLEGQLSIKPEDEEVESTEDLLRKLAGQYQDTAQPPVAPKVVPHKKSQKKQPKLKGE